MLRAGEGLYRALQLQGLGAGERQHALLLLRQALCSAIHASTDHALMLRAGELRGLYRGLQLQGLSAGERLDVLLHVKFCAKEFDCALTRELVQLIDREADLINR